MKLETFMPKKYPWYTELWYWIAFRIPFRIADCFRSVKFGFQRMFRGYDDTAYWRLNHYLTEIALPVLKYYRLNKSGIPFMERSEKLPFEEQEKKWDAIVDEMILAFQLMHDDEYDLIMTKDWKQNQKLIEKGLKQFSKYYGSLWD